jgi:hypothetical protein
MHKLRGKFVNSALLFLIVIHGFVHDFQQFRVNIPFYHRAWWKRYSQNASPQPVSPALLVLPRAYIAPLLASVHAGCAFLFRVVLVDAGR